MREGGGEELYNNRCIMRSSNVLGLEDFFASRTWHQTDIAISEVRAFGEAMKKAT